MFSAPAFPALRRAAASALLRLPLSALLFLFLLLPFAVRAQGPQTAADFLPDTDIFFDEDRASWMRYTTVPGISYTLERSLDQQTWTAVPEGSVYGTGPDMEIMVKHPSVIVPGDPLPPPPHPVYRYFIAVLGNGQAHVTCLHSSGGGVHHALISWPFAQNAFPGIGIYGSVIEPKAGYPAVPNVPYAVTFDAWALAPHPALLPTTPNPTAIQQLRMARLTDAIPWIQHDLAVNPPAGYSGPPEPAAAVTPEQRSYFRVRVALQDSDNDGLQDHVELADGTSPFVTDSDGDGLSDAVEKTNGTDGSVYNIPELTLESSSRTLLIEDSGSAPAGAQTLTAIANGVVALPLTNLPANLRWGNIPEAEGHSGELNSIVAVPHFISKMNTLAATAQREAGGWSKWETFSGADMAAYSNVRHYASLTGTAPVPMQSHKLTLTEFRYRIKASHSMPHAWPAVLQVKAAGRENSSGSWSLATSSILPPGAGGNKYVRLTLPAGEVESTPVVFSFLFTDNYFNREFRSAILRPRVAVKAADVDAETLAPAGLFGPVSTLDPDADGVVTPAELAIGTSTTTWNTTGDAVPDAHKPVEGLNGDNLFPEFRERAMDWDRVPYAAYPKPKETFFATASWAGPPKQSGEASLITDPDGLGGDLALDWQWPASALSDQTPAGEIQATATLQPLGQGGTLCHHAKVTHRQVRLRRYPFETEPERSLDYLKVTELRINGGTPATTREFIALTFPPGEEYTGEHALLPNLAAKKADLLQPRAEEAKVELQQIKLTLEKVEVVEGTNRTKEYPNLAPKYRNNIPVDPTLIADKSLITMSVHARSGDAANAPIVKVGASSSEIVTHLREIDGRPCPIERLPVLNGTISLKLDANKNMDYKLTRQKRGNKEIHDIPSGGGYGGAPGAIAHTTVWEHKREGNTLPNGTNDDETLIVTVRGYHAWADCGGGHVLNGLPPPSSVHLGEVYVRAVAHTSETDLDLPLADRPLDSKPADRKERDGPPLGMVCGPGIFKKFDDLYENGWTEGVAWAYRYQDINAEGLAGGLFAGDNDIKVSPERSEKISIKSVLLKENRFLEDGTGPHRQRQFKTPNDGAKSTTSYRLTFRKTVGK